VVRMVVACSMLSALAKSRCKLGKEDEGGKRCSAHIHDRFTLES
jgi:hypothetical protein